MAAAAAPAGFAPQAAQTRPLPVFALLRGHGDTLTIYIEGDGRAWLDRITPSRDPTPGDPVAFGLALQDAAPAVAYLGRPCQYGRTETCRVEHWTGARYGAAVLDSLSEAVDGVKAAAGARRLELVGWSGGGTVAALLADRRDDVALLVTVAANLDPDAWTRHHGVSTLAGSDTPMAHVDRLRGRAQMHFLGGKDDVVPPPVDAAFFAAVGRAPVVEPAQGHGCCWAEGWRGRIAAARDRAAQDRAAQHPGRNDLAGGRS